MGTHSPPEGTALLDLFLDVGNNLAEKRFFNQFGQDYQGPVQRYPGFKQQAEILSKTSQLFDPGSTPGQAVT